MKKMPFTVLIVSVLYILTGLAGLVTHLKDFSGSTSNLSELTFGTILRFLAIVCGVLLLFKVGWARWLAIAWLVCHIIISAFHSTAEMIAHIALLIIVSFLLFLPASSSFFGSKGHR